MDDTPRTEPKPSPALNVSPFCVHILSKKTYFLRGPPMVESDILDGSRNCWCRRTMQILGPDAEVVHPEDCRAGRSCFESIL